MPTAANAESRTRTAVVLAALALLVVVLAALRLAIGTSTLGWPTGTQADVILEARAVRLIIGALVGVALAVSGVALQALLRNPLAEPYILGLSTGAGAGVLVQMVIVYYAGIWLGPTYLGAVAGAGASMFIVFLAGRRGGMIDPLGLLLTGVVLGTVNGALIMLFNYAAGPGGMRDDLARWMMGYINEGIGWPTIALVAGVTAAGLAMLLAQSRAMDVATLSEAEAESLGVHVGRMRGLLFAIASVLAAGAVVLAGPVAFVGLICPHLARLLLGPRHLTLLLGSTLTGAALIIAADTLSGFIHYRFDTGLIPIGVFTAMLGGPAFLWMLRPQLGRGMES